MTSEVLCRSTKLLFDPWSTFEIKHKAKVIFYVVCSPGLVTSRDRRGDDPRTTFGDSSTVIVIVKSFLLLLPRNEGTSPSVRIVQTTNESHRILRNFTTPKVGLVRSAGGTGVGGVDI